MFYWGGTFVCLHRAENNIYILFLDQMKNSVLCFIFFFQLGGAFVDAENNNCKKLKATDIESVMERDLQWEYRVLSLFIILFENILGNRNWVIYIPFGCKMKSMVQPDLLALRIFPHTICSKGLRLFENFWFIPCTLGNFLMFWEESGYPQVTGTYQVIDPITCNLRVPTR